MPINHQSNTYPGGISACRGAVGPPQGCVVNMKFPGAPAGLTPSSPLGTPGVTAMFVVCPATAGALVTDALLLGWPFIQGTHAQQQQ